MPPGVAHPAARHALRHAETAQRVVRCRRPVPTEPERPARVRRAAGTPAVTTPRWGQERLGRAEPRERERAGQEGVIGPCVGILATEQDQRATRRCGSGTSGGDDGTTARGIATRAAGTLDRPPERNSGLDGERRWFTGRGPAVPTTPAIHPPPTHGVGASGRAGGDTPRLSTVRRLRRPYGRRFRPRRSPETVPSRGSMILSEARRPAGVKSASGIGGRRTLPQNRPSTATTRRLATSTSLLWATAETGRTNIADIGTRHDHREFLGQPGRIHPYSDHIGRPGHVVSRQTTETSTSAGASRKILSAMRSMRPSQP